MARLQWTSTNHTTQQMITLHTETHEFCWQRLLMGLWVLMLHYGRFDCYKSSLSRTLPPWPETDLAWARPGRSWTWPDFGTQVQPRPDLGTTGQIRYTPTLTELYCTKVENYSCFLWQHTQWDGRKTDVHIQGRGKNRRSEARKLPPGARPATAAAVGVSTVS